MYVEWCGEKNAFPVKTGIYRKVFVEEFKLDFHKPRKDYCDLCNEFEIATDVKKVELQENYDAQKLRKVQSREHKKSDKQAAQNDKSLCVLNFDLEKVLVTPSTNVSKLYYKRKLSTYNFTIYNLISNDAVCCMWHQANGGKGSSEAATCLYNYISTLSHDVQSVTLYSDTAGGQNRNQAVSAMFLYALQKSDHLRTINQKYMESGHSEMEGDSVHSMIERASRKIPIYSPECWYNLVRTARPQKPYIVEEYTYGDWLDFKTSSEVGL
jgi:hypothetical protein